MIHAASLSLLVAVFTLSACDAGLNPVPGTRSAAVGPNISEFPEGKLFAPEDIELLVDSGDDLNVDTVVVVPLAFDENDDLYSPLGFNLALRDAVSSQGDGEGKAGTDPFAGRTFFTDLGTFQDIVEGGSTSKTARFAGMYPGRRGRVLGLAPTAQGLVETYYEAFDPYSCMENPADCPEEPPHNPSPGSPGNPGNTPPSNPNARYSYNVGTSYGLTPEWPSLWRGDVISGNKTGGWSGSGSGSSGTDGHTSIVTALNSGQNTGGDMTSSNTLVMEALGYGGSSPDEIQERPARDYWIDDGDARDVYVRYHHTATWSERQEAIRYARAQDDDTYSWWTPKVDRRYWYCSKLVWRAYKQGTGDDLDSDWGWWVFPSDIEQSGHLRTVYRFRYNG